ncbi:MAG: S41 family peptidase [Acidobacteriota bacterium]
MRPVRNYSIATLVVLAVGTLAGGFFGGQVDADSDKPEDQFWTFGRVLALVEDEFVGETDSKDLVNNAIRGMLQQLDPHSNYLDEEAFAEMRDEQRGKFSGLGIQINKRGPDYPLTIIAPIDGTPADRAGLRSGDVISEINGEPTLELTVNGAVRRLKGPKGTSVTITIDRPGPTEPFEVTIERDDIPVESIRVAHMLDGDVGLIRVANFTSTTANELDKAILRLREQGMTKLLLDLRGNPGGLLDQAVQVAERFIPSGKLIVYTRGRIRGSKADYVAKRAVERWEQPLVLLVDGSSASASEIVAGAVQDHDRGLIVGKTTFGKGLVQRVIPLQQGGGALAVTTAKYFTPKGRLIQRDYSDFEQYYMTRSDVGVGVGEDGEVTPDPDNQEVFLTESGRKMYGGGGIRPDYIVENPDPPVLIYRLFRENLLFDFSVRYASEHEDLERGFEIDEAILEGFRDFLATRDFEYKAAEYEEAVEFFSVRIKAQIGRLRWGAEEESRILAESDPQVQQALKVFGEAAELHGRVLRLGESDEDLLAEVDESQ